MDWSEIFERVKKAEQENQEVEILKIMAEDIEIRRKKDPKELDNEKGASV